ncbi:Alpha/beta hydrolase fold protein [Trichormus variabilis ATCC 29413]|uniref:Alpha/beta hydrolase fold protein n=2 Tax=Anabaena variabilis TaxID=264691 RepID=Q3MH97_TRIV2|nr:MULTISPECIES: alpha/beta fold hydrolase [Nostocaceae]ABA19639.1 Alpha/beta hydrolase fold protein [Trichormus variabilis ATCC 29413]MBC1217254.1 alpha/beta fold hydrolase [Trichormus variabilis ARAD]MBC1258113.1 alpha/beta fold hydrolase [Trichormus variabilis V5]MBC1269969.1 alpha/beta fold hydrolase [Trichormus variabilis FSR]MBC1302208.1 alpha/beta fold hydrolase [Trichormus variabilis N2B]
MTLKTQPLAATAIANFDKLVWNWRNYKIQYTVMGTGQPLVLVHGFGASIGHWRKNIPVLANAGYQVFAIDLLGFGGSDKAVIDYSVDVWVELLKDFWTAHIQQPAVFVGNSIGALLSLIVLAKHPEITSGGVLINSAGGLSHRPHELNPPLRIVMATFNRVVRSPITGKFVFNRIRQKAQIRRTLYQVYRDRTAVTDELVDLLYTPSCDPGAQQVFASILTAPPGPTPEELLPQIERPLLVIWGADDPWTPITGAKIYEQAQESGQDITIIPIPGAGHCPHDEVPNVVNAQIIDWLAQRK